MKLKLFTALSLAELLLSPLEVEFEEGEVDGDDGEEDDGVVSFGGSVPAGLILNASLSPIALGGVVAAGSSTTGYALSTQLSPVGVVAITAQSYFLSLTGTDATIPCSPTNVVLLGVLFDS